MGGPNPGVIRLHELRDRSPCLARHPLPIVHVHHRSRRSSAQVRKGSSDLTSNRVGRTAARTRVWADVRIQAAQSVDVADEGRPPPGVTATPVVLHRRAASPSGKPATLGNGKVPPPPTSGAECATQREISPTMRESPSHARRARSMMAVRSRGNRTATGGPALGERPGPPAFRILVCLSGVQRTVGSNWRRPWAPWTSTAVEWLDQRYPPSRSACTLPRTTGRVDGVTSALRS